MTSANNLFSYVKENLKEDSDVILEFFILFSRVEFALKLTGFHKNPTNQKSIPAEATWDKFFKDKKTEIQKALDTFDVSKSLILRKPPRKQFIKDNQGKPELTWDDSPYTQGDDYDKLKEYIKRIRNNLFHGGKYNIEHGDPARNGKLIREAITVLKLIAQTDTLKAAFEDDLFK